jgi:hypothetical protein
MAFSSIAFLISITDVLESFTAFPWLTQFATVFHLPASLSIFLLSPSTIITIADFSDGQATSPGCH